MLFCFLKIAIPLIAGQPKEIFSLWVRNTLDTIPDSPQESKPDVDPDLPKQKQQQTDTKKDVESSKPKAEQGEKSH